MNEANFKVLLVDDSKAVHLLVEEMLAALTPSVQHAYDGSEAIAAAAEPAFSADLILLDWEMPKMNGIDAIVELKRLRPGTPVVMMTSKNAMADIVTALERGASDYVMKPFTQDILLEKVAQVASRRST